MPRPVLPRDTILGLYVPNGARPLSLAPGSAIVGILHGQDDDWHVEAYYEGAVYGQRMSFEDKIQHAAGRMIDRSPTTAFGFYDPEDLLLVGKVAHSEKLAGWTVVEIDDRPALEGWSGEPLAIGGSDAMRERAAGIAWGRMSAPEQMRIQMQAQAGGDMTELVLATL